MRNIVLKPARSCSIMTIVLISRQALGPASRNGHHLCQPGPQLGMDIVVLQTLLQYEYDIFPGAAVHKYDEFESEFVLVETIKPREFAIRRCIIPGWLRRR